MHVYNPYKNRRKLKWNKTNTLISGNCSNNCADIFFSKPLQEASEHWMVIWRFRSSSGETSLALFSKVCTDTLEVFWGVTTLLSQEVAALGLISEWLSEWELVKESEEWMSLIFLTDGRTAGCKCRRLMYQYNMN